MSRTDLPRRPYADLDPPPAGLEEVRRVALRRRRRRAIAVGLTGSATAAVVATLLVLTGSAGLDVLRTSQPVTGDPHQASPNPSPAPHATASPTSVPNGPQAGVAVAPGGTARDSQPSGQSAEPSQRAAPAPQLVRTYGPRPKAPGDLAVICGAQSSSDGNTAQTETDWCLSAVTKAVSGGVRLTVDLCRDSTSAGTLTFPTTAEADITVQRGGKVVWDYAQAHSSHSFRHVLDAAADHCWDWSVVWPDITQTGASAGHGTFTFVATSYAQEVQAGPTQSVSFHA